MDKYIYINSGGSGNVFATYWEIANSASGTITLPTGATFRQDSFQDLEDALASTISGGQPTFNAATDVGGARCVVTMDISGNYTISPAPISYPVALLYRVIIPENLIDWNSSYLVIEDVERPGGGGLVNSASNIGGGYEIFKELSSSDLKFRSLTAGSNVTIVQNANTIEISASGGGGSGNTYFPGGW
jgi:hypothetical protein